ncbi:MAG: sensor histidine kinase [Actinomycetota bacterium]
MVGHPVETEIDPRLEVRADADRMARVISNLLTNAAKFSPPQSPVRASARRHDSSVVVAVRDEGPGVAAGDRERIFHRFYQAGQNGRGGRGTGIGLSIARRYVEMHGGRIWVDGEPDRDRCSSSLFPSPCPERAPSRTPSPTSPAGCTQFLVRA